LLVHPANNKVQITPKIKALNIFSLRIYQHDTGKYKLTWQTNFKRSSASD